MQYLSIKIYGRPRCLSKVQCKSADVVIVAIDDNNEGDEDLEHQHLPTTMSKWLQLFQFYILNIFMVKLIGNVSLRPLGGNIINMFKIMAATFQTTILTFHFTKFMVYSYFGPPPYSPLFLIILTLAIDL